MHSGIQTTDHIIHVWWEWPLTATLPSYKLGLELESLKLRFHLCMMRMWTTNANATKNRNHRISIGVLPFMQMWTAMAKWIAACSDWSECECFIRWEINSHTEPPQNSIHYAEVKLHWSILICHLPFAFTFGLHPNGIAVLRQTQDTLYYKQFLQIFRPSILQVCDHEPERRSLVGVPPYILPVLMVTWLVGGVFSTMSPRFVLFVVALHHNNI